MFVFVTAAMASSPSVPQVEGQPEACQHADPVVRSDEVAPARVMLVGTAVADRWTRFITKAATSPVLVTAKVSPRPQRPTDALHLVPGARQVDGQWRMQGGHPTVVVDGAQWMDRSLVPVR